jgi:ribonucleoside-diphosphate reductase subunit M1
MYYLRTKPAAAAIQFTVDKVKLKSSSKMSKTEDDNAPINEQDVTKLENNMAAMMCSLQNKDDCLMCGS